MMELELELELVLPESLRLLILDLLGLRCYLLLVRQASVPLSIRLLPEELVVLRRPCLLILAFECSPYYTHIYGNAPKKQPRDWILDPPGLKVLTLMYYHVTIMLLLLILTCRRQIWHTYLYQTGLMFAAWRPFCPLTTSNWTF
jgi:hypothetical protein